jgi:Na+/H+ antiporter NhaD/arsenite permease-like protein
MLIAALILVIAFIFIAVEKIPKVTVAMIGGALTLALGLIPSEKAFHHVDFGVIFLLISMMIIVHIANRSGMFKALAINILKQIGAKPKIILFALCTLTAVLSALLDNVTTVFLVIPVTFIIANELQVSPIPYLICETIASNIGGTATLIGDPPNIIIGSAAGLGFMDFVKELTPVIIVIYIVSLFLLLFLFRKELVCNAELAENVKKLDNSKSIKDFPLAIRSSIVLVLVILGFILRDVIHIEAYVVAFLGASILLLFEKPKQILHDVEWMTIFFFIGLFLIVGGVIETGGINLLAQKLLQITNGDLKTASMLILWGSGLFSAVVDNIPYTATMTPLIKQLSTSMDIAPLWWCLSLGACLGGNATIIGAAANVIVVESARTAGYPISFFKFMKYGILVTFVSLVISSIYIYLKFL